MAVTSIGRRADLHNLSGAFFLIFFAASIQQLLGPVLSAAHPGWDGPMIRTVVLAAVYAALACGRLSIGHLQRRLGSHRATVLGSLTYAAFMVAVFLSPSPAFLVLAAAAWGIGAACLWTGASVAVLNAARTGLLGRASGTFYASTHIGYTCGVFALAAIGGWCGYERLAIATVPAALLGSVLVARISRPQPIAEPLTAKAVVEVLSSRKGRIVAAFMFVSAASFGLMLGPLADHVGGLMGADRLHMLGAFAAARAVMSFVGGSVSDAVGRPNVMFGGYCVAAVGMLACALTPESHAATIIGIVALGVQSEVVPSASLALIADSAVGGRRGMVHGVLFAWRDLGVVFALVFGGWLHTAGANFFLWFCLLFAACAAAAVALRKAYAERL